MESNNEEKDIGALIDYVYKEGGLGITATFLDNLRILDLNMLQKRVFRFLRLILLSLKIRWV